MPNLDELKTAIQNYKQEMIELQKRLSAIQAISPESGGDGESAKCEMLEKYLRSIGIENLTRFDAKDERVSSKVRPNLLAQIDGKKSDFSIWVMAHLDVVPPGDLKLWKSDPWQVVEKDGKLFARGVEDNQQGLVSAVFAAKAFVEKKIQPEHTVKLLFIADEEFGSEYGIKFLLREHRNLFGKDDLILIPDGGDENGETIEIAEKNILWLKIRTEGIQSHGSMPNKGKNAHLAACDFALQLNDLENFFGEKDDLFEPNYSTFQPTKKESNVETVNIIPGEDVFYMDCRILPRYSLKEVRSEIDSRARKIEEKHGVKIHIEELQRSESPATSPESAVVKRLSRAIKDAHGKNVRLIGIGGGTVGAHFRSLGFDAAIWSTLDEVCHQPNEYCKIQNMIDDAQTLAALFSQE